MKSKITTDCHSQPYCDAWFLHNKDHKRNSFYFMCKMYAYIPKIQPKYVWQLHLMVSSTSPKYSRSTFGSYIWWYHLHPQSTATLHLAATSDGIIYIPKIQPQYVWQLHLMVSSTSPKYSHSMFGSCIWWYTDS